MVFALLDGPLGGKNYLHGVAGGGARHPRAVLDVNGPTSERGGRTSPVGGGGGGGAAASRAGEEQGGIHAAPVGAGARHSG